MLEQCLKGGTHVKEPCWSSAERAVDYGKPTQEQFGKDGIPWEGAHMEQGQRATVKERQRWTDCSPHSLVLPMGRR